MCGNVKYTEAIDNSNEPSTNKGDGGQYIFIGGKMLYSFNIKIDTPTFRIASFTCNASKRSVAENPVTKW